MIKDIAVFSITSWKDDFDEEENYLGRSTDGAFYEVVPASQKEEFMEAHTDADTDVELIAELPQEAVEAIRLLFMPKGEKVEK